MSDLRHGFILGSLFFIVGGVIVPLGYQADLAALEITVVKAGDFAPGELEVHFLKHGYKLGESTEEQYLQGAQALLDAPPGEDVLEKIKPNGDIEHFRMSTGEFAEMTERGRIRTYFKADYGYWLRH